MTCNEFFEFYKKDQMDNMAPRTYSSRTSLIRVNLLPACGEEEMDNVLPDEIDAIYETLMK